ncbi:hypothetical protein D1BOALGB6SA_7248 [Olavius sp. associated proteobacterium Delta 1]|nr:hypothetical protein D1BOALGB6SA_7248 [Olavius sp. associated proteobacterium Delta 1]
MGFLDKHIILFHPEKINTVSLYRFEDRYTLVCLSIKR